MAYTALYRKFRPLKFSDMVGEEHITKTLKNQIIYGRVGHAYLFSGGRGTGKTTSAKILARAVNCLNPQNGEPCNECEICKEILNGSLTDVIEMDAASNNSVDDIREIRDEVNFLPTKAKYRVYIIDEVHMLTTGAFNALLKTLEEPPEHVKFILATTEPQKLPTTILSRCQRFDFKRISNQDIVKRLKIICEESKIKITDEALELISILAEGAMRDGISILERCAQENTEEISESLVKELVGIPSLEYISEIVKSIFEKDEIKALEVIDKVINDGKDLYNFLWEIIKYMKDVLVYKSTKKLNIYSKDEIKEIDEISKLASSEKILNIIYLLSSLENDIKWSTQKTIMFQTGIIKACIDIKNDGLDELKQRIEKLENGINLKDIQISSNENKLNKKSVQENSEDLAFFGGMPEEVVLSDNDLMNAKPAQNIIKKNDNKIEEENKEIENKSEINWQNVLNKLKNSGKIMLYTSLVNTKINQVGDMIIEIGFPNGLTAFVQKILDDSTNKKELIDILLQETGKEWHIKYKDLKSNSNIKNEIKKNNDLDININIIE